MVKCSHKDGGHDIPSADRHPAHRWRHDLSLGLEVQGRLSAHPSAATRHRACHDVGPVTPIRGTLRGERSVLGSLMTRCPLARESVPRTRRMLFGEVDVSAVIKHVPSCLSTVRCLSCRTSADRPRDAQSPASATNHVAPGEASVIPVAQKDAGGRPRRNNALNCRCARLR